MKADKSENVTKNNSVSSSWTMLTVVSVLLFAPLLSDFHDHSDTDYESHEDGLPIVECPLCLAVSKQSLDMAPELKFQYSELAYSEYLFLHPLILEIAVIAAEYPARAPPTFC